ncbi:deleted in malignant brain tumors 1 protein-like [Gigantopelta aegis]|uniref:deleted in malignant brain tumors 1 protein-like n=1 Tax=Gigantopelta aegis TaxID=1735272 RepID=UPI001B8873DE|nr:deleted in malignant brain tumors 1 protein-like [Gigantopelta aegis]
MEYYRRLQASVFWIQAAAVLCCITCAFCIDCGGYITIDSNSHGVINSPNYPSAYPNYTRCIWLIVATESHKVQLDVNFQGQAAGSACGDYIQLRDGSADANLILDTCYNVSLYNLTSFIVNSSARFMWVFFNSDGNIATTGLKATYKAVFAGDYVNNVSSPVVDCKSHQYECSNKECISMAYRCDGYEDCGCGDGCDESGCGGMDISYAARMAMGIGIGIGLFILVCLVSLLLERKHNWNMNKNYSSAQNTKQTRTKS